ncbi:MAG: M48 family metalloprotease, partial [Candidatus Woesearchaeota archaeon]
DDGAKWLQLLILIIVVPIAAMLLQLALSRSREYLADAKAAMILKSPFGLISALEKLEEGVKAKPMKEGTTATASLFIVNPFKKEFFSNLLSTHPSTKERIRRLKAMA